MSPNKTGTSMTSNCTVAAPRFLHRLEPVPPLCRLETLAALCKLGHVTALYRLELGFSLGGTGFSLCCNLVVRFWFLMPTRSYKFRLLLALGPFFLGLLLLHGRQKWLDSIRQLSLFVR